jgi:hypothetical protein
MVLEKQLTGLENSLFCILQNQIFMLLYQKILWKTPPPKFSENLTGWLDFKRILVRP